MEGELTTVSADGFALLEILASILAVGVISVIVLSVTALATARLKGGAAGAVDAEKPTPEPVGSPAPAEPLAMAGSPAGSVAEGSMAGAEE